MIKTENLIKLIQAKIDTFDSLHIIQVVQDLSMDYNAKDSTKIYGIAKVTNGTIEPVPELKESTATISIQFICPVERKSYLEQVLSSTAQSVAGVVISNSTIEQGVAGVTSCTFNFPQGETYKLSTMGETYSYSFYCYFLIDESTIQSNQASLTIPSADPNNPERVIYSELQLSTVFNTQTDTYSGDEETKSIITSISKSISFTGLALAGSVMFNLLWQYLNGTVGDPISLTLSLSDTWPYTITLEDLIPTGPVIVKFVPGKAVYYSVSFIRVKNITQ